MPEPKTKVTQTNVTEFLKGITDQQRREDSEKLVAISETSTGYPAKLWGTSIIGFGSYAAKPGSEWPLIGFSPRKQNITIYIMPGIAGYEDLLAKLGTYTTGSSCLYIKKLSDVDQKVLRQLITRSVKDMRKQYPAD